MSLLHALIKKIFRISARHLINYHKCEANKCLRQECQSIAKDAMCTEMIARQQVATCHGIGPFWNEEISTDG